MKTKEYYWNEICDKFGSPECKEGSDGVLMSESIDVSRLEIVSLGQTEINENYKLNLLILVPFLVFLINVASKH